MIPLSYNARSLVVRWSSSIMAGLGIALVVMILFILFGFVGVTMGAVVGGLGYMQVTPDLALAALFAIVTISLAAAIIPVLQAIKISPAQAFRKVI